MFLGFAMIHFYQATSVQLQPRSIAIVQECYTLAGNWQLGNLATNHILTLGLQDVLASTFTQALPALCKLFRTSDELLKEA